MQIVCKGNVNNANIMIIVSDINRKENITKIKKIKVLSTKFDKQINKSVLIYSYQIKRR